MKNKTFPMLIILLITFMCSCEEDNKDNTNLPLKDYDGNIYNTLLIGNQTWMVENLKTTHYADGTPIYLVEDKTVWNDLEYSDKAMCYYDDSIANKEVYGALYNWSAATNGAQSSDTNPSGVQGVCPNGWHLPSDDEWKELEMHLGLSKEEADRPGFRGTDEGSKLAGNPELWITEALENNMAFGTSEFAALPAGYRYTEGSFSHLGVSTNFWSTTASGDPYAWSRFLFTYNTEIYRFTDDKNNGFSVRCVKD